MGWIKRRINKEKNKHEGRLDWSLVAEKKIVSQIMKWCYKNNTIKFKDSKIQLAVTDGGWVNVLELQEFLGGSS